jgi:hypothetical protein
MTEQEITALKEYFKRELPKEFEMPGFKITDVKKFISTQFLRIEQGSNLIKKVSYDHLVRLREVLQK